MFLSRIYFFFYKNLFVFGQIGHLPHVRTSQYYTREWFVSYEWIKTFSIDPGGFAEVIILCPKERRFPVRSRESCQTALYRESSGISAAPRGRNAHRKWQIAHVDNGVLFEPWSNQHHWTKCSILLLESKYRYTPSCGKKYVKVSILLRRVQ